MRRLRKVLHLPWAARRLLALTWLLLIAVQLGVHILPFRWVWRITQWLAQPYQRTSAPEVNTLVWAVEFASRYVCWPVSRLPRALTTYILLSRAGYTATFRLGVAHTGIDLKAHAWIEWNGRLLIGDLPDLNRFVSLPSLPFL